MKLYLLHYDQILTGWKIKTEDIETRYERGFQNVLRRTLMVQ